MQCLSLHREEYQLLLLLLLLVPVLVPVLCLFVPPHRQQPGPSRRSSASCEQQSFQQEQIGDRYSMRCPLVKLCCLRKILREPHQLLMRGCEQYTTILRD